MALNLFTDTIFLSEVYHFEEFSDHKDTDRNAVSSVSDRKGLNPQDRSRQSSTAILEPVTSLLVPSLRPCIAPWWFDRIGNKPSVKADLAIYSYVLGISR